MSELVPVSIGRGSNKGRHGQHGIARFLNAYIEEMGEAGKTGFSANAINGWESFATLINGDGARRMLPVDSQLLVVAERLLFAVDSGGVVATLGGIPSDGLVTMAHNRKTPNKQVAIVCDGLWFIYEGGSLTQGSDTDLPPPIAVVEVDGYFVFLISDGRWFIAGPNEGTSIDPLDFAEAESNSDANVMGAVRGRTIIIFGEKSTEFWDPNGSEEFPFSRTAAKSFGCYAAGSVEKLLVTRGNQVRDTVIFAGTDDEGAYAGIMALEGYDPVVISTPEVDRLIRDEPDKNGIRAMAWTEDAHSFYCISGTSFSKCWDGKTGEWHDRESHGSPRWNGQCVAQFAGMTIFGHVTGNGLYRSLPTLFDEAGIRIRFRIQPPPIHMYPRGFKIEEAHFDFVTGVGLAGGDDVATRVLLNFTGVDGSTAIIDEHPGDEAHAWTAAGDAEIQSNALSLGGTGYVTMAAHSDLALTSEEFAVEMQFECGVTSGVFAFLAGQGDSGGVVNANTSVVIFRSDTNVIVGQVRTATTTYTVTGTTQFTDVLNTGQHHVALQRVIEGGTDVLRLSIDGVQEGGDVAITGAVNTSSSNWSVGRWGELATGIWIGTIDRFRLTIGTARWPTGAFTVPVGAYVIIADEDILPQVVIDYSKDGGDSFGAVRYASLGATANRKARVKERFFGRFDHNGVTFRLTSTAKAVRSLQQMALRATPLRT